MLIERVITNVGRFDRYLILFDRTPRDAREKPVHHHLRKKRQYMKPHNVLLTQSIEQMQYDRSSFNINIDHAVFDCRDKQIRRTLFADHIHIVGSGL